MFKHHFTMGVDWPGRLIEVSVMIDFWTYMYFVLPCTAELSRWTQFNSTRGQSLHWTQQKITFQTCQISLNELYVKCDARSTSRGETLTEIFSAFVFVCLFVCFVCLFVCLFVVFCFVLFCFVLIWLYCIGLFNI